MTPVQLPEVPFPYALDWPDEGLTMAPHAMRMWRRHMYDTGAEPLYTAAQLREYATAAVESERDRIAPLIDDLLALAIGHAASYQYNHNLDAIHPTHWEIITKARVELDGTTPSETNSER